MADINLLSVEDKKYEGFENLRKKLSIFSVLLLVFTAISTLATLAYFTTLASARSKLIIQVEDASSKVNSYKGVEELAVVTKEKAMIVEQITLQRLDSVKFFNQLSQIIPQDVSFSDVKISQGKGVGNGRARTSADVAGFISALVSARGGEIVSDVSIDSLVSEESGVYAFGVSANIVKGGSPTPL